MPFEYLKIKDYQERLDFIKKNKTELLEMKKTAIKYADISMNIVTNEFIQKGVNTNEDTDSVIKRTIIGNTYNWADSHGDVHLNNLFKKSIGERVGKIWHLHDHEQKITSKVGKPIDIYEKNIPWRELNVDKAGQTMALFMDSEIMKSYNEMVFNQYKSGDINQHSVGMYYVKLGLGLNDPDEKEEYALYQKYIDTIGNKEIVEQRGFMFLIYEAKLIEISAVLQGSNELTFTVQPKKDNEPSNDTQKESGETTQTKSSLFYL